MIVAPAICFQRRTFQHRFPTLSKYVINACDGFLLLVSLLLVNLLLVIKLPVTLLIQ
ncbi:MAG: hypothetical protein LBI71_11785 [Enterobacteriaceae bacterium]|nr:hypothetical protein [Enterobacteriaceae bacterium]